MPCTLIYSANTRQLLGDALRRDTAGLSCPAMQIAKVAGGGASERTAKNWLAGICTPREVEQIARLCAAFDGFRLVLLGAITEAQRDVEVRRIAAIKARNALARARYEELTNGDFGLLSSIDGSADVSAVEPGIQYHCELGGMVVAPHPDPQAA